MNEELKGLFQSYLFHRDMDRMALEIQNRWGRKFFLDHWVEIVELAIKAS